MPDAPAFTRDAPTFTRDSAPAFTRDHPSSGGGAFGRIFGAAREGYGPKAFPSILTTEAQSALESSPGIVNREINAPLARVAGTAMALGGAGFRGLQQGAVEAGEALGQPQLGRDVAAMPEAFMGTPGMFRTPAGEPPPEVSPRVEPQAPMPPRPDTPAPTGAAPRRALPAPAERPAAKPSAPAAIPGPPPVQLIRDERPPAAPIALPGPEPAAAQPEADAAPPEAAAPAKANRARGSRMVLPYVPVPREPTRLIEYLRRPTVVSRGTPMERKIPGGIKDVGGDIAAMLGGSKGRPGLINNATGRHLDPAAGHAWEGGYFPEHPERPDINDLLNAMREDHEGIPHYSMHDQEAVQAYQDAVARNSEIDQLSEEHDIPTRGMTHPQFFDALADKLSLDDLAD